MTYILPRDNKLHYSCYITWTGGKRGSTSVSGREAYINRFFKGHDNLNTPAIRFGSKIMELLEFNGEHDMVKDIPRHPHIEYNLEVNLSGVPISTHPDSVDIDNTLGVYEYKTALKKNAWTKRRVYSQKQITFYQTCIRELKGKANLTDNYLVEIPTERKLAFNLVNGKQEKILETEMEITRATTFDGKLEPVILHQRIVSEEEMNLLQEDITRVAKEISDAYHEYLKETLLNNI